MHSEFYNVELDRIRYSLVWENSATLYNALDIKEDDKVLVITSAGCNVLNALLKSPAAVVAIDLNPVQNKLLLLKKHIIEHHHYPVFKSILGLNGVQKAKEAWFKIEKTLPAQEKLYWSQFFLSHPEGIFTSGKLEHYITNFFRTLPSDIQQHLNQLIRCDEISQQKDYFFSHLHNSGFKELFIQYFDEVNLSKGRDPKLFKYATESGGESFYIRLLSQISNLLVKNNFFFRFFFFGAEGLDDNILPPCYQEKNYEKLKNNIHRLSIKDGEAIDFLLSEEGKTITKASLSNIFEYTSAAEFDKVYSSLFTNNQILNKVIFWNLLNEQGIPEKHTFLNETLSNKLISQPDACFYFRNIRIIESSLTKFKTLSNLNDAC